MKKFLLMIAAVATLFTACNNDDHECVCDDHSADLVGTWTCLTADFAEALVISADGKMVSTGVIGGQYWENQNGTVAVNEGKITLSFEDGNVIEGHFDIIPGVAFSIYNEQGGRMVFNYCKEDLADEVVGMWVLNDGVTGMTIQTYREDGKAIFTGFSPNSEGYMINAESSYDVVGDLMFQKTGDIYFVTRLTYIPDGNTLGDILSTTATILVNNEYVTSTYSFLRIKQTLDLAEKSYDYSNVYVTNVKGEDQDIPFFNSTINFSNMGKSVVDKFLKATLFNIQFPDANTIKYSFLETQMTTLQAPIVVEGNKMTIKMSTNNSACRDIELYVFQDQDNTQMHMYMPTTSFENFVGNMQVTLMSEQGQLDTADAAAVKAVFDNVESAVETINVSIVMKSTTRAL